MDPYFGRSEVSNSDLGWLLDQLNPKTNIIDPTQAFADGNLLDAMITENHKVDYYKLTRDGVKYKKAVFENTISMKKAFWDDPFCNQLMSGANAQKISIEHRAQLNFKGVDFGLDRRCKWDIWRDDWGWGGDIKSTAAETQKQFEAAFQHFHYPRSRAWYMDIEEAERDVVIGISKKNFRVFKIFINHDSEIYKQGKAEYLELAYKWYLLFGNGRP